MTAMRQWTARILELGGSAVPLRPVVARRLLTI